MAVRNLFPNLPPHISFAPDLISVSPLSANFKICKWGKPCIFGAKKLYFHGEFKRRTDQSGLPFPPNLDNLIGGLSVPISERKFL
jgi:hypothetical protein